MEVKFRDIFASVSLWLGAMLLLSASVLIETWRGVEHITTPGGPKAAIFTACSFAEVASLLQLVAFCFVVLNRWNLWKYFHVAISALTAFSFALAVSYVLSLKDPWGIIFLVTAGLDALSSLAAVTVLWNYKDLPPPTPKPDDDVILDETE